MQTFWALRGTLGLGWAQQGYIAFGHCRDTLRLGATGNRDTQWSGTAGRL